MATLIASLTDGFRRPVTSVWRASDGKLFAVLAQGGGGAINADKAYVYASTDGGAAWGAITSDFMPDSGPYLLTQAFCDTSDHGHYGFRHSFERTTGNGTFYYDYMRTSHAGGVLKKSYDGNDTVNTYVGTSVGSFVTSAGSPRALFPYAIESGSASVYLRIREFGGGSDYIHMNTLFNHGTYSTVAPSIAMKTTADNISPAASPEAYVFLPISGNTASPTLVRLTFDAAAASTAAAFTLGTSNTVTGLPSSVLNSASANGSLLIYRPTAGDLVYVTRDSGTGYMRAFSFAVSGGAVTEMSPTNVTIASSPGHIYVAQSGDDFSIVYPNVSWHAVTHRQGAWRTSTDSGMSSDDYRASVYRVLTNGKTVEGVFPLTTANGVYYKTWDVPSPPDAPTLDTPAADATVAGGVTFTWTHQGGGQTQGGYALRLTKNATNYWWDGTSLVTTETYVTTSTQSAAIPEDGTLLDGATYTWTVSTRSAEGLSGPYAPERALTVQDNAPAAPALLSPSNGATVADTAPITFDWTFNDAGDTQSAYALRRKRRP